MKRNKRKKKDIHESEGLFWFMVICVIAYVIALHLNLIHLP